jgi:hypothetical protein
VRNSLQSAPGERGFLLSVTTTTFSMVASSMNRSWQIAALSAQIAPPKKNEKQMKAILLK